MKHHLEQYPETFWFPFGQLLNDCHAAHIDPDRDDHGQPRNQPQWGIPEYLNLIFKLLLPLEMCFLDYLNDGSGTEDG